MRAVFCRYMTVREYAPRTGCAISSSLGVDLISPGEVISRIALRIHIRSTTV
jgi:hypothetical protein